MKRFAFALGLLLFPVAAWAGSTFEEITIENTAVGITSTLYDFTNDNIGARTDRCQVYIETDSVRYRLDGTNPTTTTGEPLAVGDRLVLVDPFDIQQVRFISDDVTDSATGVVTCWE